MPTMLKTLLTLAAASALAACSSSDSAPGSGDDGANSGTMSLAVTDAPADEVERVQITFDRVELQPKDGERVELQLTTPVTVENMLELQGAVSEQLFEDIEVPAGEYNFMRLFIIGGAEGQNGAPGSFVDDAEGNRFGLFVPGSQPPAQNPGQRFLQLSSPFVVAANGAADFTIDVELRDALVDRTNQMEPHYLLRPSLRLVDNAEIGHLAGEVDAIIATSDGCFDAGAAETVAAVYIYEGADATLGDACSSEDAEACPDDVDRPFTSALVRSGDELVTFSYEAGFLLEGSYTAALTCDAREDDPEADNRETVSFLAQKNFEIDAGATTEVDFGQDDIEEEDENEEGDEEDSPEESPSEE